MNVMSNNRYARCIETSKRVRWDIDKDVIRGRNFDTAHKFLPGARTTGSATRLRSRRWYGSATRS